MKAGDRVVCIDDSPGRVDGEKLLVKDQIYPVLGFNGEREIYVIPNDKSWLIKRFCPIQYNTCHDELINIVEEKSDIKEPVKTLIN